jgi:hypothetical protein
MPIKDESHFCRVQMRILAALAIALSIQACGSDGGEMTEVESGLASESIVLSIEQQEKLEVLQHQQERAFSAYAFPSGNVKAEFNDLILQKADATASKLMATSDVNGDGNADVVWTNSLNETVVSTIRSTSVIGCYKLGVITDTLMGSGDFNGDGKADLVWRNMSTGAVRISLMNGGTVTQWLNVGQSPIALNTKLEGIGDFDGNGRADMLWRNQATGRSVMSYHNADGSVASWPEVSKFINPSTTTALKVGDINGDGKDDICGAT